MKPSPYSAACVKIVADALRPIASELRLVDAADLIALLRFERHADLADLVAESADLFFMPGTVCLGEGGDYHLEWRGEPKIDLQLELRPKGVTVFVHLTLRDEIGGIEIDHIEWENPSADPEENAAFLADSLERSAFVGRRTALTARAG